MSNRLVIISLVLLVVVGLIALYGGNSLAPPAPFQRWKLPPRRRKRHLRHRQPGRRQPPPRADACLSLPTSIAHHAIDLEARTRDSSDPKDPICTMDAC